MPAEFGFTAARGMAHIDPLLDRIEVRAALAYWKVRQGTLVTFVLPAPT
jgi:hypothetical protein